MTLAITESQTVKKKDECLAPLLVFQSSNMMPAGKIEGQLVLRESTRSRV